MSSSFPIVTDETIDTEPAFDQDSKAAAKAEAEAAARVEALRLTIEDQIRRGDRIDFVAFQAKEGNEQTDPTEFAEAMKIAESAALREWGVTDTAKRLSHDAFEELDVKRQAAFIRMGGTLYESTKPKEDPKAEIIRNKFGGSMTMGEYDQLSGPQRSAWHLKGSYVG